MKEIKPKLLIIDDEQDILEIYQIKAESEGFEVFIEDNGLKGITKIVEIKPDVILLDLMMPQMNGFETLKALKNNTSLNPIVIVISNLSDDANKTKAMEFGADEYVIKSNSSPSEIIELTKKILDKKRL